MEKTHNLPYSYKEYTISNNKEVIIDYYRLYYLTNIEGKSPLIKDLANNDEIIMSVNRHVHILLNHFNMSCNISQYCENKNLESIASLVTYYFCLKYMRELKLDTVNICIFGPAGSYNEWIDKQYQQFEGVGKVKFHSINYLFSDTLCNECYIILKEKSAKERKNHSIS